VQQTRPKRLRDLASFTTAGYDKGRPFPVQVAWVVVQNTVFRAWFCPASTRVRILRAFGARVGEGVHIRQGVRVHWPWKLAVGDRSWIGEGAWLLNLEPIEIGADACISQEALLCCGSHDYRDVSFGYRNAPISVGDGAWVAARATVLPGVRIGNAAVVGAGTVVSQDVPDLTLVTSAGRKRLDPPE
jgi:putative colanic acid biosynthesis acetyltransferase WcaF